MKKTILILVLAAACLIAGCSKTPTTEPGSVLDSIEKTYTETGIAIFNESGNYENRIGIARTMHDGRFGWTMSSTTVLLSQLEYTSPVELTGIVDENTKYVVFRMNDEKIGDYYAYFFFRKEKGEDSAWIVAGREVRIIKHLSVNDFDKISIGAAIDDVAEIDPLTSITIPIPPEPHNFSELWNGHGYSELSFDTFHYTDEGILCITFSRETTDDEYTVSGIELNSSFEVDPHDGYKPLEGKYPPIKLKIEPEHLPN